MVPVLDPYYNAAPNIQGTQEGTITLTTTHIGPTWAPGSVTVSPTPQIRKHVRSIGDGWLSKPEVEQLLGCS